MTIKGYHVNFPNKAKTKFCIIFYAYITIYKNKNVLYTCTCIFQMMDPFLKFPALLKYQNDKMLSKDYNVIKYFLTIKN